MMNLVAIGKEHRHLLATIRHWSNVKIAFTETDIWLKDFTVEQLQSSSLLQIPHLTIYTVKDNLLFIKDSLLPTMKTPSALLWSPIQKALPVVLPMTNHNYFGIQETVEISIVATETEQDAFALLAPIDVAKNYILTAPEVRLKPLQWVILNDQILFLGTPILPIKGVAFWKNTDALLPTGFHFELPILAPVVNNKINPNSKNWVLWNADGTYVLIPKSSLNHLSISSLRLTL